MATTGIKISQLPNGGLVQSSDEIAVARNDNVTYRIRARQFVTNAYNIGTPGAADLFAFAETNDSTSLFFRRLTGTDEALTFDIIDNTLVFNLSAQQPIKDKYFGDGITTVYQVQANPSKNVNNFRIDIDGVLQEPGVDYSLSGNNIIFSTPPPIESKIVIVSNNLIRLADVAPTPNTVLTNMVVDNAITTQKIEDGSITLSKMALSSVSINQFENTQLGDAPFFVARAWCVFNGTRNEIDTDISTNGNPVYVSGQGNITNVLKNNVGNYTINFAEDMPSTPYAICVNGTTMLNPVTPGVTIQHSISSFSFNISTFTLQGVPADFEQVSVAVFC